MDGSADYQIRNVIHWNGSSVQSVKRAFRTAKNAAGLEGTVSPHVLRHSAATWLMQAGVEIWDAAGFLGMTVEVLTRVYGHHHANYQASAATAIGSKRA